MGMRIVSHCLYRDTYRIGWQPYRYSPNNKSLWLLFLAHLSQKSTNLKSGERFRTHGLLIVSFLWHLSLGEYSAKVNMSRIMRKPEFCLCENKSADQLQVTAKLICTFVFATRIVQFVFFLNLKFQASSMLLWLYRSVCVRPGWKPGRPFFSRRSSYNSCFWGLIRHKAIILSATNEINHFKTHTQWKGGCNPTPGSMDIGNILMLFKKEWDHFG